MSLHPRHNTPPQTKGIMQPKDHSSRDLPPKTPQHKSIHEAWRGFQEEASKLNAQIQPFFQAQQKLCESARPIFDGLEKLQSSFTEFQHNSSILAKAFTPLDKQQLEKIKQIFTYLQEVHEKLPARTRQALLTIGKHGWFFDSQIRADAIWELETALEKGNTKEAEEALSNYYRGNIEPIKNRITSLFPKRKRILNAAFQAHHDKCFELSIPTFLIQSDGICQELFKIQLFKLRTDGRPISELVNQIGISGTWEPFLYPLTQMLPISARPNERGEHFTALNRHQVLHGEDVNYPSEINSLKSISLLNYIAVVLNKNTNPD